MVHVDGYIPFSTGGLPKSPSFHQGLALATALSRESNKPYLTNFTSHYQPLRPLLIGNETSEVCFLFRFRNCQIYE